MKLKVVSGYFFDGPNIYHAGETFEFANEKADELIHRSRGNIAYVTEVPVSTLKVKARKTVKKAKSAAEDDSEEQEMSLPDADAEAAISK